MGSEGEMIVQQTLLLFALCFINQLFNLLNDLG